MTAGLVNESTAALYTIQREISPDGTVASVARDAPGGPHVPQFRYSYDGMGRVTEVIPNLGLPTTTDYSHNVWDGQANPRPYIEVRRGTTWTKTYLDGLGRPIGTEQGYGDSTPPDAIKTCLRYDAWGRKTFESAPFTESFGCGDNDTLPPGTTFAYDALGRMTLKINADETSSEFTYGPGAAGFTVTIADPYGHGDHRTTVQTYHAFGDPNSQRLVGVHDASGKEWSYTYNALDQLTAVVSPDHVADRTYVYYPGTDRLQQETHPESGTTSYEYWDNGQLKTRTDALGHVLTYDYDAVDRVEQVTASADATYTTEFHYNDPRSDDRLSAHNSYVTTSWEYDDANRVTRRQDVITVAPNATPQTFSVSFHPNDDYDWIDQVTYPDGRVVTYSPDSFQRIGAVADTARTYASGFVYHPSGQVSGYVSGNGIANTVTYDPLLPRPSEILFGTNGALLHLTYSYFDEGNVQTIDDTRQGMRQDFSNDGSDGYDALDRLTHATGPWGTLGFTYDDVGNRQTRTLNGTTASYGYDPSTTWLTSVSGPDGEPLMEYDVAGNLILDRLGTYAYTPTNLLAQAQMTAGATHTFRYDADDARVAKVEGSVRTTYTVRGLGGQALAEYEELGGQLTWTRDYIYAGSRLVATVRPAGATAFSTLTVTSGGLGSGRVLSAPAGIDCGASCTAHFETGTPMSLTAVPDPGSVLTGWSGACSGTETTTTLTLTGDATCTASFASDLAVTKVGTGAGTVTSSPGGIECGTTCSARFTQPTPVTLTATAAPGSRFVGWSGDCNANGQVMVDGPRLCVATFNAVYTMSGTVVGPGQVSAGPDGFTNCGSTCAAPYDAGSVVTLSAAATSGGRFVGWSGGCTGAETPTNVTVNAALACTATFVPVYPLSITVSGQGQVTSSPDGISCGQTCSAPFDAGRTVTLTATPASDSIFSGWSGATCTGSSLTMDQARSCTATFTSTSCQRPPDCPRSWWDAATCSCEAPEDPLLVALDGEAIVLTDVAHGVFFDVDGDGQVEQMSWTRPGTRVGVLALDLNGDGRITTGAEIFGEPVTGPILGRKPTPDENGFARLAAYDRPDLGGNGDGGIGPEDAVFAQLRLWVDANHDGVSQPEELIPLAAAAITRIDLTYQLTGGGDGQGNFFRYRGTVRLTTGQSLVIWDVLLKVAEPIVGGEAVARLDEGRAWPRAWRAAAAPAATMRFGAMAPAPPAGPWRVLVAGARVLVQRVASFVSRRAPVGHGPDESRPAWTVASLAPAESVSTSPRTDEDSPAASEPPPPDPPTETVEYYHADALGSVCLVTDESGQVLRHHDYLPFGEESHPAGWVPENPPADKKLFTGQERDVDTGLDYFGARYYRADTGRFTTVDPELNVNGALLDPQQWNRYSYVRNTPLRYIDPDGRNIWDVLDGMGNAIKSNFTLGVGRETGGNADFRVGQFAGDLVSMGAGIAEVVTGGGVGLVSLVAEGPSFGTSSVVVVGSVAVMTQGGTAATAGAAGAGNFLARAVGDMGGGAKSVNQMNQEVKRGQAPDGVIRVDKGKVKGEQDNIHFSDGSSLNRDGTWKHGGTQLTREQEKWLRQNGWITPQ